MAGTYPEYVTIKRSNVTLLGDGIGKTIITGDKNVHDAAGRVSTYYTATLIVEGDGFIGSGITVKNTAGPEKEQAVATRTSANQAAFYRCSFEGYQDTLYVNKGVQFYRECDIYGSVDFIFSQTVKAVFQNCRIYARNPGG
ncbi:unnamed protein product [Cuscuta campestris]|uniref:Pectinesterase catalytic domain-containing protein n=1 Tax=Cuscuta campestris TaxID=132261 RepID=A0A484KNA3_9ASTE|nr:unnamed protein product [Cuscuta campestris]